VRRAFSSERRLFCVGFAEGLLELLLLATAQRQYLTDGSGNRLFGEQQALAQVRASEIEAEISEI
jgi:hypothetical protein